MKGGQVHRRNIGLIYELIVALLRNSNSVWVIECPAYHAYEMLLQEENIDQDKQNIRKGLSTFNKSVYLYLMSWQ